MFCEYQEHFWSFKNVQEEECFNDREKHELLEH